MTQRYYSQIYWHFTGSPKGIDWSKVRKPADILKYGSVRDPAEATEILKKIIKTKKVLATAIENISEEIQTTKFCCVTDIPFKDLPEHTVYYGAAAIGFKAKAIHSRFLPVLYIPEQNIPAIKILTAPIAPTIEDAKYFQDTISGPELFVDTRQAKQLHFKYQREIKEHNQEIEKQHQSEDELKRGYLKNYLKITDFSTSSDQTFYREREWRCLEDFTFSGDDIAALIVEEKFLSDLLNFVKKELGESKNISCLSWELVKNA